MSGVPGLKKALNQRQLRMIAIGGVIGAGLFVGSGVVMADTGPGVFITYALSGVLIIMVMRMLAEMAVAKPSTGSFADYSRDALGHWAGFSVGWLYWYFWVIVVGFEAIAGAKIIQYWIDIPLWVSALVFMILMTATNLFSVKSYGEFEFWFAGIKVAAILAFIAIGACFVLGLWPDKSMDFSNLWSHGGFMPMGAGVITVGIVTVIFSMVGAEIATIAAAESADPEKAVAKAANSVILRILLFYVGSVFLLVTIVPWNDDQLAGSPFVAAFTKMGIPYADHIMNAVVLTAATQQAAQERLDNTLAILRSESLDADGALGDSRPLRALSEAVDSFGPDRIVIATLPPEFSVWHRFDVVDRARAQHGLPVTHVVASSAMAGRT